MESLVQTISEAPRTLSGEQLSDISCWVDSCPMSRPKKNLNRDFSDGVLMAELVHHHFPKYVELHNYVGVSSAKAKKENWTHLNRKVFCRLGINLCDGLIENVIHSKPGAIEKMLHEVKQRIDSIQAEKEAAAARAAMIGQGGDGEGRIDEQLMESTCMAHIGNPPKYLIHSGCKYVLESLLDEKAKALSDTGGRIKEMEIKNRRLETLVALKEQRLEDLTLQLHRSKFDQEGKNSPDESPSKGRLPWNGFI